jgi:uncharacterized OsmC-like protein
MSAPTTYTVEAQVVRAGVSAGRSNGAIVEFDTSAESATTLPGPADLLTMAFAACVLKNVERFSRILSFRYQGASISVTAQRQETPPKMIAIKYVLRVLTDEPDRRLELLHRNIRLHGTIYNTLAEVCDLDGEVIAETPART